MRYRKNKVQDQVIRIINCGLKSEKFTPNKMEKINWEKIYEEGKAHDILSLLYFGLDIKKLDISEYLIKKWKRESIMTGIKQIEFSRQIGHVLRELYDNEITAIALKGSIIREFYPRKEFRTMNDGDILIDKSKLEEAEKVLSKLGYTKEEGNHSVHAAYFGKYVIPIELHWKLINKEFYCRNVTFEEELWDRIIDVKTDSGNIKSLSYEDLLLHLCTHMAVHLAYSGFGLRQLIDIVVIVNNKELNINWQKFVNEVEKCDIKEFVIAIFNICSQLFNMNIPKEIKSIGTISKNKTDLLIFEIFTSGVRGKRDTSNIFVNQIAFDKASTKYSSESSIIIKFIKLLFPSQKNIGEKYNYAKDNIMLLPIAWIHHLINGLINCEYGLKEKLKILFLTKKKSQRRSQLLRKLNL